MTKWCDLHYNTSFKEKQIFNQIIPCLCPFNNIVYIKFQILITY